MQSLASARDPSAGAVKPGSETAAGSPSQGGVQSDLVTIGDDSMFERVSGPVLHVDSEQAESRQQSAGSSTSYTSMHTHNNTQHTLNMNKSSTPSRQALSKAQPEPTPPPHAASDAAAAASPGEHTPSEVARLHGASAPRGAIALPATAVRPTVVAGLSLRDESRTRPLHSVAPLATVQPSIDTQAAERSNASVVGGKEESESGMMQHDEQARRVTQIMAMIGTTPIQRTFSEKDIKGLVAAAAVQLEKLQATWDAAVTLRMRTAAFSEPAGVAAARAIVMGHRPVRAEMEEGDDQLVLSLGARYRRQQQRQQRRSTRPPSTSEPAPETAPPDARSQATPAEKEAPATMPSFAGAQPTDLILTNTNTPADTHVRHADTQRDVPDGQHRVSAVRQKRVQPLPPARSEILLDLNDDEPELHWPTPPGVAPALWQERQQQRQQRRSTRPPSTLEPSPETAPPDVRSQATPAEKEAPATMPSFAGAQPTDLILTNTNTPADTHVRHADTQRDVPDGQHRVSAVRQKRVQPLPPARSEILLDLNDDEPELHWPTPPGVAPALWQERLHAAAAAIQAAARGRRARMNMRTGERRKADDLE